MLSLFEPEMTMLEKSKLQQHEAVIERGLKTFVDVGTALLAIRDDPDKLYRQYGTFEDYCKKRWNLDYSGAYRYIQAALVSQNLDHDQGSPLPASIRQAYPLASLSPDDQRSAWQEAVDTAPDGKITGAHVAAVAERYKQPEMPTFDPDEEEQIEDIDDIALCPICGQIHNNWLRVIRRGEILYACGECQSRDSTPELSGEEWDRAKLAAVESATVTVNRAYKNSSESNEWYTPLPIIDKARAVMGNIDLDPASNEIANQTVKADKIYTIEDDALKQRWSGRVWLNPPYGNDVEPFVDKLLASANAEDITEALMLVAARTDTAWFRKLRELPRCFIWGRIKFINGETLEPGDPAGFPSMVVYIGQNIDKFIREFQTIGDLYVWMGEME